MFKPCPNCGFLVALIAGREASQRCPRCGSAMLEDGERPPVDDAPPARRANDRRTAQVPPAPAGMVDVADAARVASGPKARGHAAEDATHAPADGRVQPPEPQAGSYPAPTARTEAGPSAHVTDAAAADVGTAADANAAADTDTDTETPSFAPRRTARRASKGRRWPWALALPALALLLALQLLLSQRVELARDARWRPLLTAACGVLRCEVPAWREPSAFTMLARNVRPDATRPGVLHVTASLRNDAQWAQPMPVVVLSLSDVDGRVLAARAVTPSDYGRPAESLVARGDSVDIAFDVREPSPRVVSFDFQLR